MHLCAISLDRYIAIRNPLHHSRFNSHTKARVKIMAVWTISIGISMPIPVLGLRDHSKVFKDGSCLLTDDSFVLIGSFVAFFVPLTIMVVTYFLTINALQTRPLYAWTSSFHFVREAFPPFHLAGNSKPERVRASLRTPHHAIHQQRAESVESPGHRVFPLRVHVVPVFHHKRSRRGLRFRRLRPGPDGGTAERLRVVGYLSSAVNPLVYTLFNKTYRAAFLRYVRCRYQPEKKPLQLILVNTIPPLAYSSTQLPLDDIGELRNGVGTFGDAKKKFTLPGKSQEDRNESSV
ncbi:hypothetical protein WMY93_001635 [Mugilogobius chulae]|uniref:G-protein coupled receptors family 1 profile domain-containing protein n=1 Tax=Mugilogobius chulae TaxID=88201 RepID=A0AAW0Q2G0_9GOBI